MHPCLSEVPAILILYLWTQTLLEDVISFNWKEESWGFFTAYVYSKLTFVSYSV